VLNTSISKSNESLLDKFEKSKRMFNDVKAKSPKGAVYFPFVEETTRIGDEAVAYLDDLMNRIKAESNGPDYAGVAINKASDQSTPTRILMQEGKAIELKAMLKKTRADFLNLYNSEGTLASGDPIFNTNDRSEFESAMVLAAINDTPNDDLFKVKASMHKFS